jgi:protease-4
LEFWNITKFYTANKIGINTEQVETHQNAANYSPFVSIDENFKAVTLEE